MVKHNEEEMHGLKWKIFWLEEALSQKEKILIDLRLKYYSRKSDIVEKDSIIKGFERDLC